MIWLVLFAVNAATLGIDAFNESDYGGDEPHYLLAAESLVEDGDVDVANQYRERAYARFYPYDLDIHGHATAGQLNEPHGIGFPLMIAPFYALGGPQAVELLLAAIAALAFALAIPLARRAGVPDPWATWAPLILGVSAPALAYGATVYPELAAGAALAAAALAALSAREQPALGKAVACGLALGALPWLGTKFLPAGLVVLAALARWMVRRGRGWHALVAAEALGSSLITYVIVNDRLYGGLTPYAADVPGETATDAEFPLGYLERLPRLAALWIDRDYGLLRWAPFLALAFGAVWLLWRSRRDGLARAVPDRWGEEAAALLLALVCAAQLAVAVLLSPTMYGFWFPGRHFVAVLPLMAALCAVGLRAWPRLGWSLAALTGLASAWLYAELRADTTGWVSPASDAPLGPLEVLLPLFGAGRLYADVASGALAFALAALIAREWRHWRQIAGATRRAYSP